MAYTVTYSFTLFYEAINLSGDHREIANKRKDRIVELLKNKFDILDAFSLGSIPKFTALTGHADLDVMVVLHYGKHIKDKTPSQVLQSIREHLGKVEANVRRNGQAVTLKYTKWPHVDIVPVSKTVDVNGNITHYNVPNSNTGEWIKSRPKAHAADLIDKAKECGENFKKIIKMIKCWNIYHGNYLQSYHIEVIALKVLSGKLDDLTWCIFQFFEKSKELLQAYLWHDTGYVDDYLSHSERVEVLKRIDTAIEKSSHAYLCTFNGNDDHKTAITLWKSIFGENFPAYG